MTQNLNVVGSLSHSPEDDKKENKFWKNYQVKKKSMFVMKSQEMIMFLLKSL